MSVVDRLVLSDARWARMAPLVIGRPDQKGSAGRHNRISSRAFCGSCAPARPGATCLRRSASGTECSAASAAGAGRACGGASSKRWPTIPNSNTRSRIPTSCAPTSLRPAPKWGSGDQARPDQALGRLRGGLSIKIHLAVRGLDCPVHFCSRGRAEGRCAPSGRPDRGLTCRRHHGRCRLLQRPLAQSGRRQRRARRHLQQPSRALKNALDTKLYKQRQLIGCCFVKPKQFHSVATRFEKTARNYAAVVTLTATLLWLR